MNTLITSILIWITWVLLVYLCISFYFVNIDFSMWSKDARVVMIIYGFICGLFPAGISFISKKW